jgi:hypothetical protein
VLRRSRAQAAAASRSIARATSCEGTKRTHRFRSYFVRNIQVFFHVVREDEVARAQYPANVLPSQFFAIFILVTVS